MIAKSLFWCCMIAKKLSSGSDHARLIKIRSEVVCGVNILACF